MTTIKVTELDRQSGTLNAESLALAVKAVKEDGYVVLEDAVDMDHIVQLRDKMLSDVEKLLARKDRPFNWNTGNLQQNPPPFPPYLFRDIMVNDQVIAITKSLLGNGLKSAFYSGNTALPSESRQPVHADLGQLWPNLEVAHPPYALVINVILVDVSAANASTEIWPGTHLDTSVAWQDGDIVVSEEALEARRAVSPPLQPTLKAGSLIIRDIRMWHAGMPNHTQNPRPMAALIHYVSWFPTGPVPFLKGSEPFLEHPDLFTHAEFVDEVDHISAPGAYGWSEEEETV